MHRVFSCMNRNIQNKKNDACKNSIMYVQQDFSCIKFSALSIFMYQKNPCYFLCIKIYIFHANFFDPTKISPTITFFSHQDLVFSNKANFSSTKTQKLTKFIEILSVFLFDRLRLSQPRTLHLLQRHFSIVHWGAQESRLHNAYLDAKNAHFASVKLSINM